MGSAQGRRIAFVRQLSVLEGQIFTMEPDGTDVRQLTDHGEQGQCCHPAWSPNGLRLCFASRRDGYRSLYAINRDGSAEERLTREPAADDDFPAWSPDGNRIVFCRGNRTGADALFILDLASRLAHQLTDHYLFESSPAWSPDGRSIAFRRAFGSPPGIYALGPEGGESWFLTSGDEPAWSPDGRWLAYAHGHGIWVALLDEEAHEVKMRVRLTDGGETSDRHPSWSPDAEHIVFEREPLPGTGRTSQIVVMRRDGTEVITLAEGRTPDWSPPAEQSHTEGRGRAARRSSTRHAPSQADGRP